MSCSLTLLVCLLHYIPLHLSSLPTRSYVELVVLTEIPATSIKGDQTKSLLFWVLAAMRDPAIRMHPAGQPGSGGSAIIKLLEEWAETDGSPKFCAALAAEQDAAIAAPPTTSSGKSKAVKMCAAPGCTAGSFGGSSKATMMKCSRCKSVVYCGVECQRRHWKAHKPACKAASAAKTKSSTE
jgi:hypothetical protein